ncbi:hypothetical protein Tco_0740511, partial [Tanacetum coccineum]
MITCILQNELQRMEQELWNLTMKGDDIAGYTNRFHELAGNVTSSKPTTTHEAIHMAHNLMDQVVHAKAVRSSETNKRKWEDHESGSKNNRNNDHHQQNKRQENVKSYIAAPVERKAIKPKVCRGKTVATGSNTQQVVTCFGCREKGQYRNKFPKRKDQQDGGARGRVYVMRTKEPQQDPNVVTDT